MFFKIIKQIQFACSILKSWYKGKQRTLEAILSEMVTLHLFTNFKVFSEG